MLLALVAGAMRGSWTSVPTWPFTVIAGALLVTACGYAVSVVMKAVCHAAVTESQVIHEVTVFIRRRLYHRHGLCPGPCGALLGYEGRHQQNVTHTQGRTVIPLQEIPRTPFPGLKRPVPPAPPV
jgi:hypothetical protein